ncbi:MAG: hypothetical protein AAFR71_02620 [Pseudomonadota bacterium]
MVDGRLLLIPQQNSNDQLATSTTEKVRKISKQIIRFANGQTSDDQARDDKAKRAKELNSILGKIDDLVLSSISIDSAIYVKTVAIFSSQPLKNEAENQ